MSTNKKRRASSDDDDSIVSIDAIRKRFFEQCLVDWKESCDDGRSDVKHLRSTLTRAIANLKRQSTMTSQLTSVRDLKTIKGIGDSIALRLHSSWMRFVAECGPSATDNDIIVAGKCLRRGDTLAFVDESTKNKTVTTAIRRPLPPASNDCLPGASSPPRSHLVVDFDIILLVDNQEQSTLGRFKSVGECLRAIDCTFETRRLAIGDYIWVARCRHTAVELVLDYIVERKRWHDFAHSIKERRLHEQKQRLRQCCVRHKVLLVENDGTMPLVGGRVTDGALHQAMANTQVEDGFLIHATSSCNETARFLAAIGNRLQNRYRGKILSARTKLEQEMDDEIINLPTIDELQQASKKSQPLTVSDLWQRQLLVCPGMSEERARSIAAIYPTFATMADAYSRCDNAPDTLLALLKCTPTIGAAISAQMAQFFAPIIDVDNFK